MIPGYAGLAVWVVVLAADGESCPHAVVSRRHRGLAIEMRVHATAHRFGQRDAETASVARQPAMLLFGKLYLRTHHDVAKCNSAGRRSTRLGLTPKVEGGRRLGWVPCYGP